MSFLNYPVISTILWSSSSSGSRIWWQHPRESPRRMAASWRKKLDGPKIEEVALKSWGFNRISWWFHRMSLWFNEISWWFNGISCRFRRFHCDSTNFIDFTRIWMGLNKCEFDGNSWSIQEYVVFLNFMRGCNFFMACEDFFFMGYRAMNFILMGWMGYLGRSVLFGHCNNTMRMISHPKKYTLSESKLAVGNPLKSCRGF